MHVLTAAPETFVDPATGLVRFGSFQGGLPPIDARGLGAGPLRRLLRRKRWIYAAIAADPIFVGAAVVDVGYASNAFVFAWLKGQRGLAIARTAVGGPGGAKVSDQAGEGCFASFQGGGLKIRLTRAIGVSAYSLAAEGRGLRLEARLEGRAAPPAISAIAALGPGLVSATEKQALLTCEGELRIDGHARSLSGGLGGFDYSHGLMPRRTAWRWAYALGRAQSGERVGFNLVEGFVGEPECAVWVDEALYPVGEGRFTFDAAAPLGPWRVRSSDGVVDMDFEAGGMHAEERDYTLLVSRFRQPVGLYRGVIALPGRAPLRLDGVLGVTEDQRVLW